VAQLKVGNVSASWREFPRLPELLAHNGFEQIEMSVVQPAGLDGEVKLLTPITMENIADAVMAEGLASKEEIEQLISDL
jgi:hypothetical protein